MRKLILKRATNKFFKYLTGPGRIQGKKLNCSETNWRIKGEKSYPCKDL